MMQTMASSNSIIENYKWRRYAKGGITSTALDLEKELRSHGTKVWDIGSSTETEMGLGSRDQGHSKKSTNVSFKNLTAPKHSFVLATTFHLSTRRAEIYALDISEDSFPSPMGTSIPEKYCDLHGAFSKQASNELPHHSVANMKIEFKEGQEPQNIMLRVMSLVELEELCKYLEINLGKGWI